MCSNVLSGKVYVQSKFASIIRHIKSVCSFLEGVGLFIEGFHLQIGKKSILIDEDT